VHSIVELALAVKDARWLTIINVFQLKLTSSQQIPLNYTPLYRIMSLLLVGNSTWFL